MNTVPTGSPQKTTVESQLLYTLWTQGRASAQAWQENFLSSTSWYFENTTIVRMSLALCMDFSFTHYWGRFGLPVYLEADNNLYFINDFAAVTLKRQGLFGDRVEVAFEDGVVSPESNGDMDVNRDRGFLFGAYHYDPRRHLLGEAGYDLDSMAENLVRDHAFFTAGHDETAQRHLANGVDYQGAVMVTPHPQLNDKSFMRGILSEHQRTTGDALQELFPHNEKEGFFWCVKLYPRLGWAPDDFTRYPNLATLYEKCGSTIPLIVHSSPGGMSAADYYLYERCDDRVIRDNYDLKEAEDRFDGAIPGVASKDSPVQWRNVLKKYPRLKICLAHFGGGGRRGAAAGSGFTASDPPLMRAVVWCHCQLRFHIFIHSSNRKIG